MPSLAGAITALGLGCVSATAPIFTSASDAGGEFPRPFTEVFTDLSLSAAPGVRSPGFTGKATSESPRPFTIQFTQLGLTSGPITTQGAYDNKLEQIQAELSGSDVWLVTWTEGNVDQQEIVSSDTWRFSWVETVGNVYQTVPGSDVWTINWFESVALGISGVTLKSGTDTWSVQFNETAALGITIDTTDTWTVDWSEAGVVVTTAEAIAGTDDWTVDWDEGSLINIFVGEVPRNGFDQWNVGWSETGNFTVPGRPQKITFTANYSRIWIRKL